MEALVLTHKFVFLTLAIRFLETNTNTNRTAIKTPTTAPKVVPKVISQKPKTKNQYFFGEIMDSKTGDEGEKVQAEAWISLLIAKKLSITRVLTKKA